MLVNISEKQFTWPNQILYEGRLITRSTTEPNFALYMTSSGMMNKKIYVTREQFQRFFDGVVSNRQKKREREKLEKANQQKFKQNNDYNKPSIPKQVNNVDRSIFYNDSQANQANISDSKTDFNKKNKLINIQYYKQQKIKK